MTIFWLCDRLLHYHNFACPWVAYRMLRLCRRATFLVCRLAYAPCATAPASAFWYRSGASRYTTFACPTLPVLTDYATPWQLAGLPLERGAGRQTLRLRPYAWRNETRDNGPITSSFAVVVAGLEKIETPAGTFYARKVMFGNHQAVWYDPATTPPTPIRFFNGTETWSLQ